MEAFSSKWFILYYAALGVTTLTIGLYFLLKAHRFSSYLKLHAEAERPPYALRNSLKYFFLFTIPCLILSFIPFSWVELLFSVWSLVMVYILGAQLVRWKEVSGILQHPTLPLKRYIRFTGAIMVAVSLVMFMLSYLVLIRSSLL